jgi:hypothetical protein
MRLLKLILIMLAVSGAVLPPCPVWADDNPPGPGVLGWTITPGFGMRFLDIEVKSRQSDAMGRIGDEGELSFSLDIETPALMFGDFGATVRAHAGTLKLDKQYFNENIPEEEAHSHDVGTRVKATYKYLMPTFFYHMPGTYYTTGEGMKEDARIGIGYGKWDASLSGDIILSDDLAAARSMQSVPVSGSVGGKGGWMFFWQSRYKFGMFEFSISEVDFSNRGFDFEFSEFNGTFGYYFEL